MKTIYKSDLKELEHKEFDSVAALEKAEAEISEKVAAKQKAAEQKKAEVDVVKAAVAKRVKAEIEARKQKKEAYEHYLEICEKADAEVGKLKEEEANELQEFCKKYGGFHETITIDDVTYRYDYSATKLVDPFTRLLTSFWF